MRSGASRKRTTQMNSEASSGDPVGKGIIFFYQHEIQWKEKEKRIDWIPDQVRNDKERNK